MDLVNEIKSGALISSPYFQRNLIWRMGHKQDFIKTILLGYPFPEIFLSRGTIDVDSMISTSCIVDGQQRMSTIVEFIDNQFVVDGRLYKDLGQSEKESFLKYDIAFIDLDLPLTDPEIIEIFKRLNRTFYALSTVEKLSTEYGSSEFMLVAKLLCGELQSSESPKHNIRLSLQEKDPNVSFDFTKWGNKQVIESYLRFILESPIFTKHEISRQVHLMFTLNLMATLSVGFFNRNEQVSPHLNSYADHFPKREELIIRLDRASKIFNKLQFSKSSAWFSKANSFSLICAIDRTDSIFDLKTHRNIRDKLLEFSTHMPEKYALAAREAINNKRQRILRDGYIRRILA